MVNTIGSIKKHLPLSPHSHITLLGAGLIGRLLAVVLAQQGHKVSIYDAHGPEAEGSAARVAAAMLAPLAESAITEPCVVRMGQYSLARWPALLAQLTESAEPVFFQQNGTLLLWHRQDAHEAARLQRKLEQTQTDIPTLPCLQVLDAAGIAQVEPELVGRFHQALLLPEEGQLDNRQLLASLAATFAPLGIAAHWHSPRNPEDFALEPEEWLIDCRGLGARADWPALRGVRGEVIRLHAPSVTLSRPTRLVHPRYPIYIAPKENHHFVIGATEIESDDLSPASVRSTLELLSAAYAVHPGFAEARILEIATQCRPTLPNNLPGLRLIGSRVLQINGLYRHGFMIAPALLDAVLELLNTGQSPLARDFDLALHTP